MKNKGMYPKNQVRTVLCDWFLPLLINGRVTEEWGRNVKKPVRLIGFINYDDIEYPFELNGESLSITLYPPTPNIWEKNSDPFNFFRSLNQDTKKHEWIPEKQIKGITSEGYHVIYNVQDSSSNYHGFISYQVSWYFCYSDKLPIDKIGGFRISGHDVNLFYPP